MQMRSNPQLLAISTKRALLRGALLGLLVAVCTLGAGCGDDDDADVSLGEVELLESGSAELVDLPAPYDRSQSVVNTFSVAQQIGGGGVNVTVNVDLAATSEVASVDGGQATVEQTIDSFVVDTGETDATSPELAQLKDLEGVVLATTYDENGVQAGPIERVDGGSLPAGFEEFQSPGSQPVFPNEPVGIGARWVAANELAAEGGPTIVTATTYELTELTEDEYVIEISGETPIDEEFDDVEFTGELTESGEIRGDLSNPLVADVSYESDLEASANGQALTTSVSAEGSSKPGGAESSGLGALSPIQKEVSARVERRSARRSP